jgi:ppGpp synthetase/RelA/SpoT-type nucleotidyltranferase
MTVNDCFCTVFYRRSFLSISSAELGIEMIIDDFMFRYEREYDYYHEAARLCAQRCESGLMQAGVRAIVTYRVKNYGRLRQKIQQRHAKKNYRCLDDIYEDIVDLAGVRIALYFPGDQDEVDKFIKAEFTVEKVKDDFLPEPQIRYIKRFSGYRATHYDVRLRDHYLADQQQRYSKACIEIQVASVLMHAWAEVEHDLAYKPFNGELSEDEHAILDEINGLVLAGEIALERLQKAVKTRVSKEDSHFNNQYELAAYLYDHLQAQVQNSDMVMGRADVLFRFLQLAELNHPGKLAEYLLYLDPSDEQRTIAGQLVDRLLATNPGLYGMYSQAKNEVDTLRLSNSSKEALGYFMSRWIALETVVNLIARVLPSKNQQRVIAPNAPTLMNLGLFVENAGAIREIEQIRRFRNEIVHGVKIPDNDALHRMGKYLEDALLNLSSSSSGEVHQLIETSDEIQKVIREVINDRD